MCHRAGQTTGVVIDGKSCAFVARAAWFAVRGDQAASRQASGGLPVSCLVTRHPTWSFRGSALGLEGLQKGTPKGPNYCIEFPVPERGLEPRFRDSKSLVLPLDDTGRIFGQATYQTNVEGSNEGVPALYIFLRDGGSARRKTPSGANIPGARASQEHRKTPRLATSSILPRPKTGGLHSGPVTHSSVIATLRSPRTGSPTEQERRNRACLPST